jgi:signal transduction histidine kinase
MSTQHPVDSRSTLLARLREREEQAEFLVNAGKLMRRTNQLAAADLDVDSTLAGVARLTLPYDGVWSLVDVCEDGNIRRVKVSHPVPAIQRLLAQLRPGWPAVRDRSREDGGILRTGRSEIVSNITDQTLCMLDCSTEQRALLRQLRVGSVLAVAMRGDDGIIGSLTFVSPRGGHEFDDRDRHLAEDIAAGATVAITGARLEAGRARDRATAETTAAERLSFMSSLSHGVRTPLHNIFGYAQLLEAGIRGPLTEAQRNDIGRIRENERHLLNLVDAVITFARWDGTESPALEDVVVRDALAGADRDIAGRASRKGVKYDVAHDEVPADLVVRAEPQRLTEILTQLLQNAVAFSRPGGSVVVRALPVRDCIWIRVSDTGTGIAEEDVDLIFHPFVRGRDAYVRAQDGVGLGLAIARKLARSMDGEVFVVSNHGKGSTFTLALPRGRRSAESTASGAHAPL